MKKTVLGILTVGAVLSACASTAFAAEYNIAHNRAEYNGNGERVLSTTSYVYTDTDENGICDIRDAKNESNTTETGKAFIDKDENGVCDNYTSAQNKSKENGYRNQGEHKGNLQGELNKNFVDADNDGVCDNYTPEKCKCNGSGCNDRSGCQNGFRGRRIR